MGIFSAIGDFFNNIIIKSTFDPAADQLKQLYRQNVTANLGTLRNTVGNIGGGLGNAILSIPGIGPATMAGLSALQKESEDLLKKANNMSPDQLAQANDDLQQKAYELQLRAQAEGKTVEQVKEEENPNTFSFSRLFTKIYNNTVYIIAFFVILFLALLGSSLASNAAIDLPIAFRIYYMVYGFILFPISLLQGMYHYMNNKKLFYALWAPLIKRKYHSVVYTILLFPFVYNDVSPSQNYTSANVIDVPIEEYQQQ